MWRSSWPARVYASQVGCKHRCWCFRLIASFDPRFIFHKVAAPVALPPLPPWPALRPSPAFRAPHHHLRSGCAHAGARGECNARLSPTSTATGSAQELPACDMRRGVRRWRGRTEPAEGQSGRDRAGSASGPRLRRRFRRRRRQRPTCPSRTSQASSFPAITRKGAVTGLRARPGGGYAPFICRRLPRVADAEALVPRRRRPARHRGGRAFGWHVKGRSRSSAAAPWAEASPHVRTDEALTPGPGALSTSRPPGHRRRREARHRRRSSRRSARPWSRPGRRRRGYSPPRTPLTPRAPSETAGNRRASRSWTWTKDSDLDVLMTNGDMFDRRHPQAVSRHPVAREQGQAAALRAASAGCARGGRTARWPSISMATARPRSSWPPRSRGAGRGPGRARGLPSLVWLGQESPTLQELPAHPEWARPLRDPRRRANIAWTLGRQRRGHRHGRHLPPPGHVRNHQAGGVGEPEGQRPGSGSRRRQLESIDEGRVPN